MNSFKELAEEMISYYGDGDINQYLNKVVYNIKKVENTSGANINAYKIEKHIVIITLDMSVNDYSYSVHDGQTLQQYSKNDKVLDLFLEKIKSIKLGINGVLYISPNLWVIIKNEKYDKSLWSEYSADCDFNRIVSACQTIFL